MGTWWHVAKAGAKTARIYGIAHRGRGGGACAGHPLSLSLLPCQPAQMQLACAGGGAHTSHPLSSPFSLTSRVEAHPRWDTSVRRNIGDGVALDLRGIFSIGNDSVTDHLLTKHRTRWDVLANRHYLGDALNIGRSGRMVDAPWRTTHGHVTETWSRCTCQAKRVERRNFLLGPYWAEVSK